MVIAILQCIKMKFKLKQYSLTNNATQNSNNNNPTTKKCRLSEMMHYKLWYYTYYHHYHHIITIVLVSFALRSRLKKEKLVNYKKVSDGNAKSSNGFLHLLSIAFVKRMFRDRYLYAWDCFKCNATHTNNIYFESNFLPLLSFHSISSFFLPLRYCSSLNCKLLLRLSLTFNWFFLLKSRS